MITVMDPWQADAVMVGDGHAPVVAVLPVFAEEGGSVHPRTQRSAIRAPRDAWLNHAVCRRSGG
jgi:hypothetical protein